MSDNINPWVLEERRAREARDAAALEAPLRRVYVVMGNDYPDAVFTTEAAASAYCRERAAGTSLERLRSSGPRVYWRYYDFPLLTKLPEKVPPSVLS